jgi:hypothetical protein
MDRIYHDWDNALSENDTQSLLKLWRAFLGEVVQRKPPMRQYYRTGYLSDGKNRLIFEYPRAVPEGEQMDFVEVIELNGDGLIQYHKVYWGWRGFAILQNNRCHRPAQPDAIDDGFLPRSFS